LSSKNVLKKKQKVKARIKYFILFKYTKLTYYYFRFFHYIFNQIFLRI
jgi:hypothetical protein